MEMAIYFLDGTSYSKTYWQPYRSTGAVLCQLSYQAIWELVTLVLKKLESRILYTYNVQADCECCICPSIMKQKKNRIQKCQYN